MPLYQKYRTYFNIGMNFIKINQVDDGAASSFIAGPLNMLPRKQYLPNGRQDN